MAVREVQREKKRDTGVALTTSLEVVVSHGSKLHVTMRAC
jgi:hypothetical protein